MGLRSELEVPPLIHRQANGLDLAPVRALNGLLRWYFSAGEHPSKLRIVRWLGNHVIPEEGLATKLSGDLTLLLHPRDCIEAMLLRGEEYEPLTLDFLRRNLHPGDGAVLAGINFGLHVAHAARAVTRSGIVLGIEPQPAALLRCRRSLDLNGLGQQVKLCSAALGATRRSAHMAWSSLENPGAASFFDGGDSFIATVVPLDALLPELGEHRFRVVLLDVQGFELEVLRGLSSATKPELLVVEIDPEFVRKAGIDSVEIGELLRARGYDLFTLLGQPLATSSGEWPERNLVAVAGGAQAHWVVSSAAASRAS